MTLFLTVLGVMGLSVAGLAVMAVGFVSWLRWSDGDPLPPIKTPLLQTAGLLLILSVIITIAVAWGNSRHGSGHGSCQVGHYVTSGKTTDFVCDTYFPSPVVR